MNSFRELQFVYEGYTNAQTVDFPSKEYKTQEGRHTYPRNQYPGNVPGSSHASAIGIPVENEEENPSHNDEKISKQSILEFINSLINNKEGSVSEDVYDIITFIRKS